MLAPNLVEISSGLEVSNQPTFWRRTDLTTAFCHSRFCRAADMFATDSPGKAKRNCAVATTATTDHRSTMAQSTEPPADSASETLEKKGLM